MKSILFLVIFFISYVQGRIHPGFSQESSCHSSNRNWMSKIDDSRLLRYISIPGTHDSLALYGGEQWQCQTMTLLEQLLAGIRALDIRCRHVNETFKVFHQFVDQKIDFSNAISIVRKFLQQNPTETILMRIKKEWIPEGNKRSFMRTFREDFFEPNFDIFWEPKEEPLNIQLGDVRGKIVILQDFSPEFSLLNHIQMKTHKNYGILWDEDTVIQDDYVLLTTWSLYPKWLKVKEHLLETNQSYFNSSNSISDTFSIDSNLFSQKTHTKDSFTKLFINFLSGSVGVKPYFVASGHTKWGTNGEAHFFGMINMIKSGKRYSDFPKSRCFLGGRYCLLNFEGINPLVYNYLTTNKMNFVGIIFADFPGCGLIQSIIDVNFSF